MDTDTVWSIDAMEAVLDRGMIPAAAPVLFVYKTGTTRNPDIEWSEADVARFPYSRVYRIHQGYGDLDPFRTADGAWWDEADLETQAWTVPALVGAISHRNASRWSTRVYASDGPWSELLAEAARQDVSMRSVFWREANWNLNRAEAAARIGGQRYSVQWASPSSNALTLIPGTGTTLQVANLDLSETGLRTTGWQG